MVKKIVERTLNLYKGQITYINKHKRIQLLVGESWRTNTTTSEIEESTLVSAWISPLQISDAVVKQVFSEYVVVSQLSKINYPTNLVYYYRVYIGKRLIHFYEVKKAIPDYISINSFKTETSVQG